MSSPDDITKPIKAHAKASSTTERMTLRPGERGQIILAPLQPVCDPMLFLAVDNKTAIISLEQFFQGPDEIFRFAHLSIESFRYGRRISGLVSEFIPIKVVLANGSPFENTIRASLVGVLCITTDPEEL